MRPSLAIAGLVAAGVVALGPDVDACGDKSLSAGGIRMQRALAARYPASILIYATPNSRIAAATRELNLHQTLQQVGHKYREVATWSDLEALLDSGQFNIVLTDFAELAQVRQRLESSRSRPVVLPVAYKLTKAEASRVAKQNRFLIKAPSRAAQYLNTIVEAVRSSGSNPSSY